VLLAVTAVASACWGLTTPTAAAAPGAAGATVSAAPAASPAGARAKPKPKLLTGAKAKRFVVAALNSAEKHGPYRATMAIKSRKTVKARWEAFPPVTVVTVPPDRSHVTIGAAGDTLEIISIGAEQWIRTDGGEWQKSEDDASTVEVGGAPTAAELKRLTATEIRSTRPALRLFRITYTEKKQVVRGTVAVDRAGRVRSLTAAGPLGSLRFTYAYDPGITVQPPV
jgi:hypothetical protein